MGHRDRGRYMKGERERNTLKREGMRRKRGERLGKRVREKVR
jgi:hypothetical protein